MKVDLRNNMLDENQQQQKMSKKKQNLFSGFFGGGKGVEKLEEGIQVTKSLEAPEKIKKLPKPEESIKKIESPGIGEADFQVREDFKSKDDLEKDNIEKTEAGFQKFNYSYEESEYIKGFPEKVLVKWQGPDYEIYPKSRRWYMVAGLILSAIVVYAVLTNSPLTAIVFILIGIVGYMHLERDPQLTDFAISYDGVVVGNEVYEWDDIVSFWIFYDPPHTRVISLHMKGKLMPYIHIPLHQIDPVEVREKMMDFVPELKQEQGMVDVLERLLHM